MYMFLHTNTIQHGRRFILSLFDWTSLAVVTSYTFFFFPYKWDTIGRPCLCLTKPVWSCAIISMLKDPIWPPLLSLTERIWPPWRHEKYYYILIRSNIATVSLFNKQEWRPWRHAKNYYLLMNSTWPPFLCSSKPGWRPCGHALYFPYRKFQYGDRDVMHKAIKY